MDLQLQETAEAAEIAAPLLRFRSGYPPLPSSSLLLGWSAEKPGASSLAMFCVTSVALDLVLNTADRATAPDILLSWLWIDTALLGPTQ
jgi:hypothetical protein